MKGKKIFLARLYFVPFLALFCGCFDLGPSPFEQSLTQNEEAAGLGAASGNVELHFEEGEIHINVSDLPALAEGEEYEAAATLSDGDEIHLGELEIDDMGMAELEVVFEEDLHDIAQILVILANEEAGTETVILSATIEDGDETTESEEATEEGH